MIFSQSPNQIDFQEKKLFLPKEVEFYLQSDDQQRLVPTNTAKIRIIQSLQGLVEESDLFKEEDKKRFVFGK